MRAVTLTHNDFDGLGCVLMLMIKFKPEAYFFTNYYDFDKAVDQVIKYKRENDVDTLLIADLSFSDHPQLLEKLSFVFEGKIFLVDHHMYPDGFWGNFNFKKIIDTERCATRILFEDLKLNDDIKDPEFRDLTSTFVRTVDTWDRWCDTDPGFEDAMYSNELFLNLKTDNASIVQIAKNLIGHRYGVFGALESFKKLYDDSFKQHLKLMGEKNLIWRFKGVTFIFSWDFLPAVIASEYKQGQPVVVAVQGGIFKVRINKHDNVWTEDRINALRRHLTGLDVFCHLHAFTYKVNDMTPKILANECEKITKFIASVYEPEPDLA